MNGNRYYWGSGKERLTEGWEWVPFKSKGIPNISKACVLWVGCRCQQKQQQQHCDWSSQWMSSYQVMTKELNWKLWGFSLWIVDWLLKQNLVSLESHFNIKLYRGGKHNYHLNILTMLLCIFHSLYSCFVSILQKEKFSPKGRFGLINIERIQ